ncbi:MAG: Clp protease N-terminal domain-containing protein [Acidimicrobiaceae bacterium]|nr:Clp protease N-terminal domain-containing protein [Acidimicrobiaceae bacterium]
MATEHGRSRIGTEHVLIVALEDEEGIVWRALVAVDVDPAAARSQLIEAWRSVGMARP